MEHDQIEINFINVETLDYFNIKVLYCIVNIFFLSTDKGIDFYTLM